MTEKEDKEDKAVRQFVLYCHAALKYEKLNYYNERRHRLEREAHQRWCCALCRGRFADSLPAGGQKGEPTLPPFGAFGAYPYCVLAFGIIQKTDNTKPQALCGAVRTWTRRRSLMRR